MVFRLLTKTARLMLEIAVIDLMVDQLSVIKLAFIKKADDSLVDDESTNIHIYDVQRTKKESMQRSQDHPVSEFTHAGSPIDSISLSIAELLKDVKG